MKFLQKISVAVSPPLNHNTLIFSIYIKTFKDKWLKLLAPRLTSTPQLIGVSELDPSDLMLDVFGASLLQIPDTKQTPQCRSHLGPSLDVYFNSKLEGSHSFHFKAWECFTILLKCLWNRAALMHLLACQFSPTDFYSGVFEWRWLVLCICVMHPQLIA